MDKFNANFPFKKKVLSFEVCQMKMQVIVVRLKDHSQGYVIPRVTCKWFSQDSGSVAGFVTSEPEFTKKQKPYSLATGFPTDFFNPRTSLWMSFPEPQIYFCYSRTLDKSLTFGSEDFFLLILKSLDISGFSSEFLFVFKYIQ